MDFHNSLFKPIPLFQFDFSTYGLFRCTKRSYAQDFCSGSIYFGSPRNWIEIEKKGNKGQGDVLEGVFCSCHQNDQSKYISSLKSDALIEHFVYNDYLHFRYKSVLDLRCLCFYGLRDNTFIDEHDNNGKVHNKSTVTKEYFFSFTDCCSRDDYNSLPKQDQPVVVMINNPHEFLLRIRDFLLSLDVKLEEIIVSPVQYLDRNVCSFAQVNSPMELLIKDISFKEQSEIRIIINSKSEKYIKYMKEHGNIINIGSIEDITSVYDYYFDDMVIERIGEKSFVISLPEPQVLDVDDFSFFELEDLLVSVLLGTVTLNDNPSPQNTWQEKLKFLIDIFYEKYGVTVLVDENRNVTMQNMSNELLDESKKRNISGKMTSTFSKTIVSLIESNDLDKALEECEKVYSNDVLSGAGYYYTGVIQSINNDDDTAIMSFLESYKRYYLKVESLDRIAAIYYRNKNYEKAIEYYLKIQDEKGYDSDIYFNIGLCYLNLTKYIDSVEYFNKSIDMKKSAFAVYNKGVALVNLNRKQEALLCFKEAHELNPTNELINSSYLKLVSEIK